MHCFKCSVSVSLYLYKFSMVNRVGIKRRIVSSVSIERRIVSRVSTKCCIVSRVRTIKIKNKKKRIRFILLVHRLTDFSGIGSQ